MEMQPFMIIAIFALFIFLIDDALVSAVCITSVSFSILLYWRDWIIVVGILSWSNDSQYICTRNDSMPTILWIWDIRHLELAAILVQKDPIRAAAWDPTCTRLVLCTGSTHLYMWTPSGAYCVHVPLAQFTITDLKWNSDGSCLFLKDKESFCCAAVPLLPESSEYSSDD